ncbi:MAG: hypothetical protein U5R48_19895 [Gammaproteobacteria bacterium]|nr:hypothetical protein [Gammaproteobacteria bacterium]
MEKLAGQGLPKLMSAFFERAQEGLLVLARMRAAACVRTCCSKA